MSDPNDTRLRGLVRELVDASPPPPPLPPPPGQRSWPRVRVAALAAALALVIAGAAAVGYVAANRGGGDRTNVRAGPGGPPIAPARIVAHVLSPIGDGYKSEVVQLASDDGHVQRALAEVPDGIVVYAATADRDSVYVDAFDGSTGCPGQAKSLGSVLRVPRRGGDARLEAHGFRPALSPDRNRLAYVRADCGEPSQPYVPKRLAVRRLANDEERVWSLPQPYTDGNAAFENVGPLVWSADRTHLLMRIVGGGHTSWWWVNTTAPAGVLDATQLPIPDDPQGPRDIIALGQTGRWAALMPGQSADSPLAIVEYHPFQATAGDQLTTIQPPGGRTARLVDADASGQHLLLIVTESQTQTSTLYSWSRGEAQPSEIAQHVVAADW
jgi:hypothetical protein